MSIWKMQSLGLENFVFVVVEVFKVDPEVSLETNKTNLLTPSTIFLFWLPPGAGPLTDKEDLLIENQQVLPDF